MPGVWICSRFYCNKKDEWYHILQYAGLYFKWTESDQAETVSGPRWPVKVYKTRLVLDMLAVSVNNIELLKQFINNLVNFLSVYRWIIDAYVSVSYIKQVCSTSFNFDNMNTKAARPSSTANEWMTSIWIFLRTYAIYLYIF